MKKNYEISFWGYRVNGNFQDKTVKIDEKRETSMKSNFPLIFFLLNTQCNVAM